MSVAQLEPERLVARITAGSVHLPASADISSPHANGTSLEFIQPDGTIIVIPGGAITGFALFLGDIQIPDHVLVALLEAQGIKTAAGPSSSEGAHGSFEVPGPQTVGQGDDFASGLLGDSTAVDPAFAGNDADFGEPNLPPVLHGSGAAALDEAELGQEAASIATGTIAVSDTGPVTFALAAPVATLTSGGVALSWQLAGATLIGSANGMAILIATISSSGSYAVTLLGPLDHAAGQGANDLNFAIPVTVTDTGGLTASTTIGVSVADDVPVALADVAATILEDAALGACGNVLANDDLGADGAVLSRVKLDGEIWLEVPAEGGSLTVSGRGTYTFAQDGTWTFVPAADFFGAAGFEYVLRDGDGDESGTATQQVDVTPVNDAPVLTPVDDTGAITEDVVTATSGSFAVSDVDNSTLTASVAFNGASGQAQINFGMDLSDALRHTALTLTGPVNGILGWQFSVPNALLNTLGAGQTLTAHYIVTVSDGAASVSQPVVVTITGSNDAPVITAVDVAGEVTDGGTLTTAGSIEVSDPESTALAGTASFVGATGEGGAEVSAALLAALQAGAFGLSGDAPDANGVLAWNFSVGSDLVAYLTAGQSVTVTYRISVSDGLASDYEDVTITIIGATNAPPPVVDADSFEAREDAIQESGAGIPLILGNVLDGDTDPSGLPLTVVGTGKWSFNETDFEVLVSSVSATGNRYRIWNQDHGVAIVEVAANGAVRLWAESGDPFRGLGVGETCTITFEYQVSNGETSSTATATITITGTNDGPVARSTFVDINEDSGLLGYNPAVAATDDAGWQNLTARILSHPSHAKTFTVYPDGTVDYIPDDNYFGTDSFTYQVMDAQGFWSEPATITFRIAAVEDTPYAWGDNGNLDAAFRMTEDAGPATFNQLANDRLDGDGGNTITIDLVAIAWDSNHPDIQANDLRVTVGADGRLTVELLGDDWQALQAGETAGVKVTYTLYGDRSGQSSSADMLVRVTGSNDAPVLDISADLAVDVRINAGAPINGLTNGFGLEQLVQGVTDPDGFMKGVALTGIETTFGKWFYSEDGGAHWLQITLPLSDANALLLWSTARLYFEPNPGYAQTIPAGLQFRAWDGTSGTPGTYQSIPQMGGNSAWSTATEAVALTFSAANAAPQLAAIDQPAAVAETPGTPSTQDLGPIVGTLRITDLDPGDTLTASVVGKATVTKNGTTTMTEDIQALDEVSALTFDASVVSNGGEVSIGWTYDPQSATFDFLGTGDTLTVTYTVRVTDGVSYSEERQLTFQITGTNDAPAIAKLAGDAASFTEDGPAVALDTGATAIVTDVDNSDFRGGSITATITNGVAAEDVLSLAATGGLSIVGDSVRAFVDGANREVATISGGGTSLVLSLTQYATPQIANALIGALRYANTNQVTPDTTTRTVTITLADGDGGTATATTTVQVNPMNDNVTIVDAAGATVTENVQGAVVGTFTLSDVDPHGFTFTVLSNGATDARFEVVPDPGTVPGQPGLYEVRLKAGQSLDFEAENADGNPTLLLDVQVREELYGSSHDTASITVTVADVAETPSVPPAEAQQHSFETGYDGWETIGLAQRTSFDGDYAIRLDTEWNGATPEEMEQILGLAPRKIESLVNGMDNDIPAGGAQYVHLNLQEGQTVSFSWYFATEDDMPMDGYLDFAFVTIDGELTKLSAIDAIQSTGNSGWQTYEFTAPADGIYTLGIGVINMGDNWYQSRLYVDDVTIGAPPLVLLDTDPGIELAAFADDPATYAVDDLTAVDLIADYDFDDGDRIDLSAVLDGVGPEHVADFIRYVDGTLSVDTDGTGPADFVAAAKFSTPPDHLALILDNGFEVVIGPN